MQSTSSLLIIIFIIQLILLTVIFYPQLKKGYEKIKDAKNENNHPRQQMCIISQISEAAIEIQKLKKGSLIIVERNNKTDNVVIDGEILDSKISKGLLINIFEGDKTPLHDGAVVIRGDRILIAGGFISSLTNKKTSRTYGTRHRAAIGLTQSIDCVALVVSEESGAISIVSEGSIKQVKNEEVFEELSNILIGENYYKK
jgi:diadenylate cyclase